MTLRLQTPLLAALLLAALPAPASAGSVPATCVQVSEYESFCFFFDNCAGFQYEVSNGQYSRGFSKGVCLDNGVAFCDAQWDDHWPPEDNRNDCVGVFFPPL